MRSAWRANPPGTARGQERLMEAAKLGFTRALIPEANRPKQAIPGMEVIAVRRVEEAVTRLRDME
jgi:DNA repair protein RadA/Sms